MNCNLQFYLWVGDGGFMNVAFQMFSSKNGAENNTLGGAYKHFPDAGSKLEHFFM